MGGTRESRDTSGSRDTRAFKRPVNATIHSKTSSYRGSTITASTNDGDISTTPKAGPETL